MQHQEESKCCGEASWHREEISDRINSLLTPSDKFDYVDVDDFLDYSILNRLRYSIIFLLTLKSILVYMAGIPFF
jgi:hypothetical protein